MLWACILLPQLALDSVLRVRDDPDTPLVLLSGPAQRRVLQAVNEPARQLGLRAGQTLSTAQAMAQGFACVEHDPDAVEQLQQLLAAWAYGFSAQVSLHYPRTLLLEVGSTLGLFGPWPQFEARLREELNALGLRHRIVLASNPVAARMLANVHDGLAAPCPESTRQALRDMPVERVGLPADASQALQRMGLRHLDQVLALPRDTLARRFAASVQLHLDRLLGLRAMALACYLPADRFDARLELNFDVESHQALLFPMRRLIADLAAFLASRDGGVQRFVLHLEHAGELPATQVKVGLLAAEREAGLLFELARGRLEPLQIIAPVRSLRLVAEDLPAFVPQPGELFNARPQQQQGWEQLRERLRARLGDEAVQGLQGIADHRPECAWRADSGPPLALTDGPPRPGWLLPEPQPLPLHGVRLLAGPERVESGWWDGGDVRRDYYCVETQDGQRGWAYRTLGEDGPLWLQGWFA